MGGRVRGVMWHGCGGSERSNGEGNPGVGDALGDDSVDGAQSVEEFGRGVRPIGGHQGMEDPVVDLGVAVGEEVPVAGEDVLVAVGDALDQPVAGQTRQIVGAWLML